jgi:hypothetical protein
MDGMKPERDTKTGKFKSESEPNRRKLTVRLPDSLADELEQAAGSEVAAWVRQAISEKLERQNSQKVC